MSVRSEKNGGGGGATGAHVAARALDLLRGLRVLLPQVLSLLVRGLLFLLLLLLLGAGAPSSGACHGPCRVCRSLQSSGAPRAWSTLEFSAEFAPAPACCCLSR
jgi:hypothetical protein